MQSSALAWQPPSWLLVAMKYRNRATRTCQVPKGRAQSMLMGGSLRCYQVPPRPSSRNTTSTLATLWGAFQFGSSDAEAFRTALGRPLPLEALSGTNVDALGRTEWRPQALRGRLETKRLSTSGLIFYRVSYAAHLQSISVFDAFTFAIDWSSRSGYYWTSSTLFGRRVEKRGKLGSLRTSRLTALIGNGQKRGSPTVASQPVSNGCGQPSISLECSRGSCGR